MGFENDQPDSGNLMDGNKDETEIPIGEVQDIEARNHTMWRCGDCGELGKLWDTLPEQCPEYTAPKEKLFYSEQY